MEQVIEIQTAAVRKACQGNRQAQSWLYEKYSAAMFNICIRMTGNRSDAEDVLQNAFITAFRKLDQLKDEKQFGGWLKRIVVNECIAHSRRAYYWSDWEDHLDHLPDNSGTEWWKQISLEMMHREIKGLPDGCRQIFNLYVFEDYSHKEIAEALGISESTSKTQYQRARQLLKERIQKQVQIHG